MPLKTTIILWMIYLLGQTVHTAMKANLTIRSNLNGTNTYLDFIKANGIQMGARFFLCTMIFLLWWDNPTFLADLVKRVSPDLNVSFPLNYATSGIYGYCSDSLLDKIIAIAGLQKEVPPSTAPQTPPITAGS